MYPLSFLDRVCSFFRLILRFKFPVIVVLFFLVGLVGIFKVFGMAADPRVTAQTLGMNPYSMDPMFYAHGQPYWMPDYVMSQWMMHQNQGFYGHNPANFWLHNFSSAGSCNKCSKNKSSRRNRFTYYVPGQNRSGKVTKINVADVKPALPPPPAEPPPDDDTPAVTIPDDSIEEEVLDEAPPPVEAPEEEPAAAEPEPAAPEPETEEKPEQEEPSKEEEKPGPICSIEGQTVRPGLECEDIKTAQCLCPVGQVVSDGKCVPKCTNLQEFDSETCKCKDPPPPPKPKDFCSTEPEFAAPSASGASCVYCNKEKIKNLFNQEDSPVSLQELEEFLTDVNTASGLFAEDQTDNVFKSFKNNFCGPTCGNADVGNFVNYVKKRSQQERVPFEVLLGLILKESRGKCDAGPGKGCKGHSADMCNGPRYRNPNLKKQIRQYNLSCRLKPRNPVDGSFGLFQLNLTHPNICEYKVRKKCNISNLTDEQLQKSCQSYNQKPSCILYSQAKGQGKFNNDSKCQVEPDANQAQTTGACLNNPYCSFEEALNLLKRKRNMKHVKRDQPSPTLGQEQGKPFKELTPEERDHWRRAIMTYNSSTLLKGSYEFNKLPNEQNMQKAVGMGELKGWELERMFLLNAAIYSAPGNGSQAAKKQKVIGQGSNYRFPNRSRDRRRWLDMLGHLSYMEQIAGREVTGGGKKSFICQWEAFEEGNQNLSCP